MGIGDIIAALEAVCETVRGVRRQGREAAGKYGDAHTRLTGVFDGSRNPKTAEALEQIERAAERLRDADGEVAAALALIGEYIEVVKGNRPLLSTTGPTAVHGGFEPTPYYRDMPSFPGVDRKTHGRALGKSGEVETIVSGELDPDTRELDPLYVEGVKMARRLGLVPPRGKLTAAGDVELKWALRMREDGMRRSHVAISNTGGPCEGERSCDSLLPIWLEEGSELTVHWRDGQGDNNQRTYKGAPDERA